MVINIYLLIITLTANGLNAAIKRQWVADQIKKQEPTICYLQEAHIRVNNAQTESEQMEKDISCKQKW